jgi:hypothetical protein
MIWGLCSQHENDALARDLDSHESRDTVEGNVGTELDSPSAEHLDSQYHVSDNGKSVLTVQSVTALRTSLQLNCSSWL